MRWVKRSAAEWQRCGFAAVCRAREMGYVTRAFTLRFPIAFRQGAQLALEYFAVVDPVQPFSLRRVR